MLMRSRPFWLVLASLLSTPLAAAQRVDLDYHVRFLPDSGQAEVQPDPQPAARRYAISTSASAPMAATATSRPMASGARTIRSVASGVRRRARPR